MLHASGWRAVDADRRRSAWRLAAATMLVAAHGGAAADDAAACVLPEAATVD